MTDYADLEMGLHRRDTGSYAVEFRFSQPNSEADVSLGQGQLALAEFDLAELNRLAHDPSAYGQELSRSLFADPDIKTAFTQARTSSQVLAAPLRLRLRIGPGAPELHSLRWETLVDPQDGSPLATSENLLFSRYLSSTDWQPLRLRPKGELRALVVVANPANLASYNLPPVDVEGEVSRAKQGLSEIPLGSLPDAEDGWHATLENLVTRLRQDQPDILYLACHGGLVKDQPWLWLEDDQGQVARHSGDELVTRLKELLERPRLVFLATCESAGDGVGEALSALGPRLAEAGIPAVLAMQGTISMQTISTFMPVFFQELQRDGHIDRAVAVARGSVRKRPDHWMPALFMRLKSGRIWYVPGFGEEEDEFEKWNSLAGFIQDKTCTPIVGLGMTETLLGSRSEIAIRWAEKNGFPLAVQDRDVLPRVAQYVITRQSPAYLQVALREAMKDEITRRYPSQLPDELRHAKSWTTSQLTQVYSQIAKQYWSANPQAPYKLLAELRLPIYITSGWTDLISDALKESGAEPVVRICPWNKWIPKENSIFEGDPTPEKPLVYHLFGHINVPNSLVMAEDRYFDYLIGVTLNKSLIPPAVRAALSSTSLLFLGFQMDDWDFRVFFRYLMAQEGRERLKFYSHASAQIEPEEDRIVDIKRARKYLEEYFESEQIAIYWGSADEFLKELWQHL